MSEFDASPRTSKRRKITTSGSNSSGPTSTSLKSPSVVRSLSNAVSGIGQRLFEPATHRARPSQAVDVGDGTTGTDSTRQGDRRTASLVEEEQGDRVPYDTDGRTERTATTQNGAAGIEVAAYEDVHTPGGSATKPRGGSNGAARGDGSRRSSKRKPGSPEETAATGSHTTRPTRSSRKREMTDHAAGPSETPEMGSIDVAPTPSPTDRSAAAHKQRRSSIRASASCVVEEEEKQAPLEAAEDDGNTVVCNQRSSGREKRRPRRYSADMADAAQQRRKRAVGRLNPLTPRRTGAKRPVAVEDAESNLEDGLNFQDIEGRRRGTDTAKRQSKAAGRDLEAADEPERFGLSQMHLQVAAGPDSETDELAVEDAALADLTPALDSPRHRTPLLDSAPEADEDPSLTAIKATVLSRLTSSRRVPLAHLATEYSKIHSLVEATVSAGEGNSILVLGARGSGKTNLIETALADIGHDHADDFHVVRLNGFQQTDDQLALREIWRQLGREMQVEEDETKQVSSYADTMASLLHLLSHPDELAVVLEPEARARTAKSVVFVLDEFDLFATHPRQTLLYNLFDLAQAKKAPVAVIGCSTRVDVADSLEKRVKSRFSHRWVHLAAPKSFPAFAAVIEAALCVAAREGDVVDDAAGSWRAAWNSFMTSAFIPSPPVQARLRQIFSTTKSIPAAFAALYLPIAGITSLGRPFPGPVSVAPLTPPDSVLELVPSLAPLHLCLLISAARLDAIHNASVVNFHLVYDHYVELASRARLQSSASGAVAHGGVSKIWGREVAQGAWEELGQWAMLVPAVLGPGKGDEAPATTMWRVDVTLEELGRCVGDGGPGVGEVLAKWCKEV